MSRRKKQPATPAAVDWPPGYEPQLSTVLADTRARRISARQSANRAARSASGKDPQEPKL